jgi:hypothetical protein
VPLFINRACSVLHFAADCPDTCTLRIDAQYYRRVLHSLYAVSSERTTKLAVRWLYCAQCEAAFNAQEVAEGERKGRQLPVGADSGQLERGGGHQLATSLLLVACTTSCKQAISCAPTMFSTELRAACCRGARPRQAVAPMVPLLCAHGPPSYRWCVTLSAHHLTPSFPRGNTLRFAVQTATHQLPPPTINVLRSAYMPRSIPPYYNVLRSVNPGRKMSKSLKNFISIEDYLNSGGPHAVSHSRCLTE